MEVSQLIVNADDFGWSERVNSAVARTFDFGTITSASLMACGPALPRAIQISLERKGLGVGLHFTLTQVNPISPASKIGSLCNPGGTFFSRNQLIRRLFTGRIRAEHVRSELASQLKLADQHGLSLTHIDGHQHVHVLPGVLNHVLAVAEERNLAIRIPNEQIIIYQHKGFACLRLVQMLRKSLLRYFCGTARRRCFLHNLRANNHFKSFFGLVPSPGRVTLDSYQTLISNLRPGTTELMVHPVMENGDSELWGWDPSLRNDRQLETDVLLDQKFRTALRQPHIRLINYGDL